ncbi:uncharacterized protein M6B38_346390 [Iris pallida]|uniref:Uncharacterized protein n=1 Tax=Iris pallida TaxID=29817 RepID=A0AAX6GVK5_IRIPA|nr:uncharacterized protein M6B38_346390 [Iris pallida]
MDSTKLSATFLLLTILLSTTPPSLSCGSCPGHNPTKPHHPPKSKPSPNKPPRPPTPPRWAPSSCPQSSATPLSAAGLPLTSLPSAAPLLRPGRLAPAAAAAARRRSLLPLRRLRRARSTR